MFCKWYSPVQWISSFEFSKFLILSVNSTGLCVSVTSSGVGRSFLSSLAFPFLLPSPPPPSFIYLFACLFIFIPVQFTQQGGQGSNMTGDHLLRAPRLARRQFSLWPMVTFFDYVPYARDSVLNASISPCLAECNRAL